MKKPVIGVVPLWDDEKNSIWMLPDYLDGLRAAGALPVVFPLEADEADICQLYNLCDGLLFTGGHDVDPALYGQTPSSLCGVLCPRRDALEAGLFRLAMTEGKPMLGICRGIQLINVLVGGTLYQDLPTEHPSPVPHVMKPPYDRTCHTVRLVEDGVLRRLLGREELGVNSYHHQAVCRLAPSLRAEAWSPDGLVEAAVCPEHPFLLAVQWHPELCFRSDPAGAAIFQTLVDHC